MVRYDSANKKEITESILQQVYLETAGPSAGTTQVSVKF